MVHAEVHVSLRLAAHSKNSACLLCWPQAGDDDQDGEDEQHSIGRGEQHASMDRDLPSMGQRQMAAALARDSLYIVDRGVSSAKNRPSICERSSVTRQCACACLNTLC